jgi:hypothetical protein
LEKIAKATRTEGNTGDTSTSLTIALKGLVRFAGKCTTVVEAYTIAAW